MNNTHFFIISDMAQLQEHIRMIHAEQYRQFGCNECDFFSDNERKALEHLKKHEKFRAGNVSCDLCGKGFTRRAKLNIHLRNIHQVVIEKKPKTASKKESKGDSVKGKYGPRLSSIEDPVLREQVRKARQRKKARRVSSIAFLCTRFSKSFKTISFYVHLAIQT